MPRITDPAVRQGKLNRNADIQAMFADIVNKDYTVDKAIRDIKAKYGLSESTIMKIIKGTYKMASGEADDKKESKQLKLFDNDGIE